ncbi:MAG: hypothetical protein QXY45_00950 [Candidatus Aenigmatarchaeota archaeon]
MEIDLVGAIAIGLALIIVSLLLIKFIADFSRTSFLKNVKEMVSNLYSQIFGKSYYNVCESFNNSYISMNDFETLINAYYHKRCGDAKVNVILSFSVTKDDINKIAKDLGVAKDGKLVIYESAKPVGMGGIIIDGYKNPTSRFVFKANDRILIWNDGSPEKDVLLNLTEIECDPYTLSCKPRSPEFGVWMNPITKDKKRGEECRYNSECSGSMVCVNGHCCSPGETWDGTSCVFQYTFTILFIHLKEKGQTDGIMEYSNFQSLAENFRQTWSQITPLSSCLNKVGIIISEYICEVPVQDDICSGDNRKVERTYKETTKNIMECVEKFGYGNIHTRVVGVVNKESVCGNYYGYSGGYNSPVVISNPSSDVLSGIQFLCSHEMGHTFGLCDEGYGNSLCSDCRNGLGGICSFGGSGCFDLTNSRNCKRNGGTDCPNVPEGPSIMCTFDSCSRGCSYATTFAQTSYQHLQGELNEYCE